MKNRKSGLWPWGPVLVSALALFCTAPLALADTEPNNTCGSANDMGEVALPAAFSGELTQPDTAGDVDFYLFQATSGAEIEVNLQGSASGNGTLPDPFLGFFDSSCNLIEISDDYLSLDSRLVITVPADGSFVLAATGCCDGSFEGFHSYSGTYLLTLSPFAAIGSISGRVVDAETNPHAAQAVLYACDDPNEPQTCGNSVADVYAVDGTYSFTNDYYGAPLNSGSYLVRAYDGNLEGASAQFSVGEGEHYAVPDITITEPPSIGSISGWVVDEATNPLEAYVELYACDDPGDPDTCWNYAADAYASDGAYNFTTGYDGFPLAVGSYLVRAYAGGYQGTSDQFSVGEGEHYSVPDITIVLPPSIGSISGRVVDAQTSVGLSGWDYPYAWLELQFCDSECYGVAGTSPDGDGYFRFAQQYPGQLPPGSYRVVAYADEYLPAEQDVGMVGEGEDVEMGDVPMNPYPIDLSVANSCGDLPPAGGTCRYQVRITNRSGKQIKGAAWSIVDGSTGSLTGYTQFQTAPPTRMVLMPGTSRLVWFEFSVPASVPDWGYFCSVTRFGENLTKPFFNTLDEAGFCVQKLPSGFTAMSKKEVREIMKKRKELPETAKGPIQR
jgi:hypothetical protein